MYRIQQMQGKLSGLVKPSYNSKVGFLVEDQKNLTLRALATPGIPLSGKERGSEFIGFEDFQ